MAISRRDHALDGLRGLAAVVVVVHHSVITSQLFADAYFGGRQAVDGSVFWFVYSPLHVVWAGGEAVFVFFILSGLVLTLPVLRRRSEFDWVAYYPSRLIRLYLPVWASVIFAFGVIALFPRDPNAGSDWMVDHAHVVTLETVLRDSTLLNGSSGINTALWSLKWEVLFSLLLPLYVWLAVKLERFWLLLVAASLLLIGIGMRTWMEPLQYLPMFMVGVVIATRLTQLKALGERIDRRPRSGWIWAVLAIASWLALASIWTATAFIDRGFLRYGIVVVVLGGAGLVMLALVWPAGRRFLETRPMQFLGTVSFSLYLIHEPIVVATAQTLPPHWTGMTVFIALPLSIAVSWLFFRVAEGPSHRLAQWVRRRLGRDARAALSLRRGDGAG